jgi:hypothetical protein
MSRHDAVARIDKDIEELESRIVELKRKRNSLAHICRLPNELLVFLTYGLRCMLSELHRGMLSPSPVQTKPICASIRLNIMHKTCIFKASWARIGFWGTVTQEAMVKNFPANLTILHVHTLRTFAAIAFLAVLADQLVEIHIGETYLMMWPQVAWPRLRRFGVSEPTMWQKKISLQYWRV